MLELNFTEFGDLVQFFLQFKLEIWSTAKSNSLQSFFLKGKKQEKDHKESVNPHANDSVQTKMCYLL